MFNFLLWSDFSLEGESWTTNQNDDIFVCPVQSHLGEPMICNTVAIAGNLF